MGWSWQLGDHPISVPSCGPQMDSPSWKPVGTLSIFTELALLVFFCGPHVAIPMARKNIMGDVPSGKRLHNYGKSPFSMGKSTISMAIFNSYVSHYQRVLGIQWDSKSCFDDRSLHLIRVFTPSTLLHTPLLGPLPNPLCWNLAAQQITLGDTSGR